MHRGILIFLATFALASLLSQTGSYLVEHNLEPGQTIEVTSYFDIHFVRNYGGVFGIFQGKGWLFALLSTIFLAILAGYVFVERGLASFEYVCYGLIVGGGVSNVLDRLIYGSVIDFIDLKGIPNWYYVFNTADTLIHLGIWPLLLMGVLRLRKPQNEGATVD
jgi:signal peptidase II